MEHVQGEIYGHAWRSGTVGIDLSDTQINTARGLLLEHEERPHLSSSARSHSDTNVFECSLTDK
jgi:hypothetical protein